MIVPEEIPNSDIEGRLTALREVIKIVLGALSQEQRMQVDEALQALTVVADGQEDPGAVVTSAFAVEGARAREIRAIRDTLAER
jgi:hypothetical protein